MNDRPLPHGAVLKGNKETSAQEGLGQEGEARRCEEEEETPPGLMGNNALCFI